MSNEDENLDTHQKIAKQWFGMMDGMIKCSRCEKKANSVINDVAYCPHCYDTYYMPNMDLLENYQNVQKAMHCLDLIEVSEKNLLTPANQVNLANGMRYLTWVFNRLKLQMEAKKLL